jgi:DNA-binding NarL/FixJ family response regulator
MSQKIAVVVEDLFFLSRIQQTARLLKVELVELTPEELPRLQEESGCSAAVVDLNHRSGQAIPFIRALKQAHAGASLPVIGFLSHVQGDLAVSAREAGCDVVMARSAFSQRLAEILTRYSGDANAPAISS